MVDPNPTTNKGGNSGAQKPADAPAAAQAAPAVPDERYRKVVLDEAGSDFFYGDKTRKGVTVNRIDLIRQGWQTRHQARGAIAKELTRLTGKKVTYQIIFSATKNLVGGPPPAAPAQPAQPANA